MIEKKWKKKFKNNKNKKNKIEKNVCSFDCNEEKIAIKFFGSLRSPSVNTGI